MSENTINIDHYRVKVSPLSLRFFPSQSYEGDNLQHQLKHQFDFVYPNNPKPTFLIKVLNLTWAWGKYEEVWGKHGKVLGKDGKVLEKDAMRPKTYAQSKNHCGLFGRAWITLDSKAGVDQLRDILKTATFYEQNVLATMFDRDREEESETDLRRRGQAHSQFDKREIRYFIKKAEDEAKEREERAKQSYLQRATDYRFW